MLNRLSICSNHSMSVFCRQTMLDALRFLKSIHVWGHLSPMSPMSPLGQVSCVFALQVTHGILFTVAISRFGKNSIDQIGLLYIFSM